MTDRVYEYLFRGFIEEEQRGNTYHVVLNIGGKLVGPLSPQQADAAGWPLSRIVADINAQAQMEAIEQREQIAAMAREIEAARESEAKALAARDAAEEKARGAFLVAQSSLGVVQIEKAQTEGATGDEV